MFRQRGIELEGVPLVSMPLCNETCMHASMHCVALWCSQWSQQEMDEQQATYGSTHSEDIAAISEHDSVDGWSQVPSSLSASEPEANLQEVWTSIIAEYEAQDAEHRYGHMRQSMFTTKFQLKLKGKD